MRHLIPISGKDSLATAILQRAHVPLLIMSTYSTRPDQSTRRSLNGLKRLRTDPHFAIEFGELIETNVEL